MFEWIVNWIERKATFEVAKMEKGTMNSRFEDLFSLLLEKSECPLHLQTGHGCKNRVSKIWSSLFVFNKLKKEIVWNEIERIDKSKWKYFWRSYSAVAQLKLQRPLSWIWSTIITSNVDDVNLTSVSCVYVFQTFKFNEAIWTRQNKTNDSNFSIKRVGNENLLCIRTKLISWCSDQHNV